MKIFKLLNTLNVVCADCLTFSVSMSGCISIRFVCVCVYVHMPVCVKDILLALGKNQRATD